MLKRIFLRAFETQKTSWKKLSENSILSCRNRAITNTEWSQVEKPYLSQNGGESSPGIGVNQRNHLKLPINKKCFIISMSRHPFSSYKIRIQKTLPTMSMTPPETAMKGWTFKGTPNATPQENRA